MLLLQYSLIYVDLGLQLNSVSIVADRSLFFMYSKTVKKKIPFLH